MHCCRRQGSRVGYLGGQWSGHFSSCFCQRPPMCHQFGNSVFRQRCQDGLPTHTQRPFAEPPLRCLQLVSKLGPSYDFHKMQLYRYWAGPCTCCMLKIKTRLRKILRKKIWPLFTKRSQNFKNCRLCYTENWNTYKNRANWILSGGGDVKCLLKSKRSVLLYECHSENCFFTSFHPFELLNASLHYKVSSFCA